MTTLAESLAERIKLVSLSQGSWGVNKLNKPESLAVKAKHNLSAEINPLVHVPIVVDEKLDTLKTLKGQIYTQHRLMTLPSIQEGQRILPVGKELEHSNMIRDFRPKWDDAVEAFGDVYQRLADEAPLKYGGLYDSRHWLPKSVILSKFRLTVHYLPCSTEGAWGDWLEQTAEIATAEYRQRIVDKARHLVDKCRDSDGRIFRACIDNLQEICGEEKNFNLANDPIIKEGISKFNELAAGLSVEALRENTTLREDTAKRAEEILGLFGN